MAPPNAGDGRVQRAGLRRSGWRLTGVGLGWLTGLALQLQQPVLWPLQHAQCMTAAGTLGLLLALWWPPARRLLPLMLVAAALAFGSTAWRADSRLADRLDASLEGQDLLATGVVASLPQTGPAGTRFLFDVESATLRGAPVRLPPRLALGWYAGFHDEAFLDDPRADLQAGQRWRLPLRLKRPHGSLNPEGYDVELQWFEQAVGATGYVRVVRGWSAATLLAEGAAQPVDRLRQHIRDALLRTVADARAAGVLAALAVGDQAAIERDDWELFRTTGIAHLVSISGVHVTMFAWLAGLAVGTLWRRSPALMLRLPAPVAARWLGLLAATGYALLAGWGVPAQRTVLMLAITVALRSAGWRWPWALVLLAAAVGVTVADPWALLQPGFWLSFAAVALLMASEPAAGRDAPVPGWRGLLAGHLRAQLVAALGLAPLSLVFFQQFSAVGILANLVAIPLVTLLITPLALLGMLVPPLWLLAAALVQAMVWGLGWLAQVPIGPFATWTVPAAPAWQVAAGVLGALLAVLPAPGAWRWLAAALVLPLLWPPVPRPAPGQFSALVADVGQGTAVLLRTREHLLVYDAGPQYSRESDAGQRVLLPLLRARGERRVDLLMLSHRDTDHVGGAASLLDALPVRALSSSLDDRHPLRQRGLAHTACRAGQRWTWDGVLFRVLHPTDDEVAFAARPNAVSCVLRIEDAAGRSLLLTGDIEAPQEAALLQRDAGALASTVLLVPHHGSRTSSTAAFLDAVQPQLAVVQAGYRSRFGHPAADVLARHDERGIAVVRTDACGAWLWHDGVASCTRDVRRRYWHAASPDAGLAPAPVGGAIVANPPGSGALSP